MAQIHPVVSAQYLLALSPRFMARRCRYEKKVKDYNFGSLIRTDAREEYGEKNTIFGPFVDLHRAVLRD